MLLFIELRWHASASEDLYSQLAHHKVNNKGPFEPYLLLLVPHTTNLTYYYY